MLSQDFLSVCYNKMKQKSGSLYIFKESEKWSRIVSFFWSGKYSFFLSVPVPTVDRGKTASPARILSPNPTQRPLPCLLIQIIQSFFYAAPASIVIPWCSTLRHLRVKLFSALNDIKLYICLKFWYQYRFTVLIFVLFLLSLILFPRYFFA